jgi:hypothetical protein
MLSSRVSNKGAPVEILLSKISINEKRQAVIDTLKREGRSVDYIKSYLRGWDALDKSR